MAEKTQLERIEEKLDRVADKISAIEAHQAADLQRFEQIDARFIAAAGSIAKDLQLHAAHCDVRARVAQIEDRLDAATNKAAGARWAGSKLWAAIVGVLVLVDLAAKIYQAVRPGG